MECLAELLGKFLHNRCLSRSSLANQEHGLVQDCSLTDLLQCTHGGTRIHELARLSINGSNHCHIDIWVLRLLRSEQGSASEETLLI